jgi:hypothetical protein
MHKESGGKRMTDKIEIKKNLINARLLKNYGSWMYCGTCGNPVGYLCYSTYTYFRFDFICSCGAQGSFELEKGNVPGNNTAGELITKKGRLCCPNDESPMFSIVEKNLKSYDYTVRCKECNGSFHARKK